MSVLAPGLAAELEKDVATIFGAVEINFTGADVRLLDGSAQLTFGGNLFSGEHATFGSLSSIEDFEDGTGDEAPGLVVTLIPNVGAAAADISNAGMQGARVRLWIGAVNETTGAVIAEPYLLFNGEIDIPTLRLSDNDRSVEYACVGGMEKLFEAEEGIRLAPAFHQVVWPGETGLNHVTGIQDNFYWGQNTPNNGITNI
jgi:hypothetical protein